MIHIHKSFFLFLASVLLITGVHGQSGTGTVKGTLTDESGAVIPAATLTITGAGGAKVTQSQGEGSYAFTNLAPGQYTVSIAFPGFAPFSRAVTVSPGATVQLPVQLSLSAETQQVTVSGQAGPTVNVEPDNNATALVIQGEDLQALPGRSGRSGIRPASSCRTRRGPQRRPALYRRIFRRTTPAQRVDP